MDPDKLKKIGDRLAELARSTPSLSEEVDGALHQIIGERVQFFGIAYSPRGDGEFYIAPFARFEGDSVERLPEFLALVLERMVDGTSRLRVREEPDTKQ